MKAHKDIDTYIADYPKDVQVILKKLRATIKKAAPKAKEAIKYGIPTFVLNGNLVHFGAYKHHIGFYPASGRMRMAMKELAAYEGGKGTIRFPIDEPLPWGLIAKIVKFRVKENALRAKKSN